MIFPSIVVAFNVETFKKIVINQLISDSSLTFRRKNLRPEDKIEYFINEKKDNKRVKAHINSHFFKQLKFLLGKSCRKYVLSLAVILSRA